MSKVVLVISYDQPEELEEAIVRLSETAEAVRELFVEKKDVQVHVAIRETADEVLNIFKVGA